MVRINNEKVYPIANATFGRPCEKNVIKRAQMVTMVRYKKYG